MSQYCQNIGTLVLRKGPEPNSRVLVRAMEFDTHANFHDNLIFILGLRLLARHAVRVSRKLTSLCGSSPQLRHVFTTYKPTKTTTYITEKSTIHIYLYA